MVKHGWTSALLAWVALSWAAPQSRAFQVPPAGPAASTAGRTPRLIPRTSAEREQRFLTQHRIILNVHVSDSAGKPHPELSQADFTVLDNAQARNLVNFRSIEGATGGAHVVLVLDALNNFTRQIHSFAKDIEQYLKEGEESLPAPVSIGLFSGYGIDLGKPSRDRSALLAELKSKTADLHATGCVTQQDRASNTIQPYSPGAYGNVRNGSTQELVCKNDRFVASINALSLFARREVDEPGRVIVIWLGPGWPMLTDKAFTPDPPELKQSFFERLVSLSTLLREAQVTVDAVGSPDDSINPQTPDIHDYKFFDGISSPDQVSAADMGLHPLAHQTGGRIFPETKDVAGQIRECVNDAASYYVLSFDAPPAPGFGEFHTLAVKIDKPGLDVRTNTLYYAEQ
ncbi:MAG TPA: VWA domain-containing protein [Terracidiphilus sp.]